MPRGTVHQAVAQEEASTHLTISTYQGFSYGVLAQAVLQTALEGQQEPVCMPHALRKGLPWGFLYDHGLQVGYFDILWLYWDGFLPWSSSKFCTVCCSVIVMHGLRHASALLAY